MNRLATFPRPAANKHLFIQLGVLLLIVSGASWNYDAWLFVRLRIIANDSFTFGSPQAPLLLMDDSEELRTFKPTRVAEFLHCPSSQIRTVAFLSLADRGDDRDPREWVGITPRLLHAFAGETDDVARACAESALVNLPLIPIEDVPAAVAFVESTAPNDGSLRLIRTALVSKILSSDPERLSWVTAVYQQWLESPEVKDRRTGFEQLMALAPNASETVLAFKRLMKIGDPDGIASAAGRRILMRHPNLIEECLSGNAVERRFVLDIAIEEARFKAHRWPLGEAFTEGQLQRIHQWQEGLLAAATTTDDEMNKACKFLRYRPHGSETLLAAARQLHGRKQATALQNVRIRKDEL